MPVRTAKKQLCASALRRQLAAGRAAGPRVLRRTDGGKHTSTVVGELHRASPLGSDEESKA